MRLSRKPSGRKNVTEDDVSKIIPSSWTRETSYDPSHWSLRNSAWGQCAVSALLVQDLLGGDLLAGKVNGIEHYWNRLAGCREFDLTRDQFGQIKSVEGPNLVSREFVLSFPNTLTRYQRLRKSVLAHLAALNVTGREKRITSATARFRRAF